MTDIQGISLHIGLNEIDPAHYGTTGKLRGCENDARDMQSIAAIRGYQPTILLTPNATAAKVLKAISSAAKLLKPKGTFMLTYAGHGSQVRDINREEDDTLDETWCLYDRMLIDDELYQHWAKFQPGVRIIMVSDSCHSGTVARTYLKQRAAIKSLMEVSAHQLADARDLDEPVYRALPSANAIQAFQRFKDLYKPIKCSTFGAERSEVRASVVLLAACQDNQTAADGSTNGWFTKNLLAVWNNGRFVGDYKTFHQRITAGMPASQSPKYFTTGLANPTFERESPFTISGKPSVKPPLVTVPDCPAKKAANQDTPTSKGVTQMQFTRTTTRPSSDAKVTVEFAGLIPLYPGPDNTCVVGIHRWTYSHTFQATLVVRTPNSPPRLIRLFSGPLSSPFCIRLEPDPEVGLFKAFVKTDEPFVRNDPNNDDRDYRWSINLRGNLHPWAETNDGAHPGGLLKAGVLYTSTLTRDTLSPKLIRGEEEIPLYRFAADLAAAIVPSNGFKVGIEWYEMGETKTLILPRQYDSEDTTYVISLMNDPPMGYPEYHDEIEHYYKILHVDGSSIPSDEQWELDGGRTTDEIPCMPTLLEP